MICIQETKREDFDINYIKKFFNRSFSKFVFEPSIVAPGGLIVIWQGNNFESSLIDRDKHSLTIKFTSKESGQTFHLTNIYGPVIHSEKLEFIDWSRQINNTTFGDWIILGDFNLIKSLENRSRDGGNATEMLLFNDAIQYLDLVGIPFKGRSSTWSNMQQNPLCRKLTGFLLQPPGVNLSQIPWFRL